MDKDVGKEQTLIHQYKNNGYNIVLDVNSGCVHVVDELVYDIIALYETETKDTIKEKMLSKYKENRDVTVDTDRKSVV